jgi:hypothetical protein
VRGLFKLNDDVPEIKSKIADMQVKLEEHGKKHVLCESNHEQHCKYRRENDEKLGHLIECVKENTKASLHGGKTLEKILTIIEENAPEINYVKENKTTIDRTRNKYITADTIKGWAAYLSIIVGGASAVYGAIQFIKNNIT